jgi:hypothetical protein
MGLLKWKNDVGRGTERKALSRGRSISGMVLDGGGVGRRKFKLSEVRNFNQFARIGRNGAQGIAT